MDKDFINGGHCKPFRVALGAARPRTTTCRVMEALLARETAIAEASAARAAKAPAKVAAATSLDVFGSKKKEKGKKPRAGSSAELASSQRSASAQPEEAVPVEADDDESDDELVENGYAMPELVEDPRTAAEAEAAVDRRVYVEGMVARKDLNRGSATVIAWRSQQKRWEIEMDKRDERVLALSRNLGWLDGKPPAAQKLKKKRADDEDDEDDEDDVDSRAAATAAKFAKKKKKKGGKK